MIRFDALRAATVITMVRWMIAIALVATATQASADPSHPSRAKAKPRIQTTLAAVPAAPRTCAQPACAAHDGDHQATEADGQFHPVDVKIPIGGIAIASMEGLWLRRGPTLRHKPIMVSPIVVGDALTLSLGGSF